MASEKGRGRALFRPVFSVFLNILLLLAVYSVCRGVFFLENKELFPGLGGARLRGMFLGGLRFDLTAILYASVPYLLLSLLPFRLRETKPWRIVTKWLFVLPNFVCTVVNLCDVVYFPFTGKRTTWSIFQEFGSESNLGGIFLHEAIAHWYLVLLGIALLLAMIFLYSEPKPSGQRYRWTDYLVHTLILAASLVPVVSGMRGGLTVWRPISLQDANDYCSTPTETGIVLNTAFSMMRTIGNASFPEPQWMSEEQALELFNPIKTPAEGAEFRPKNVVVFILESFSASYSQFLTGWQGKEYEGYMPFLDSLMQESLVFRHSFAHDRQSICALSAIMAGLPTVIKPYILSPYANNRLDGFVTDLVDKKGYSSVFYHGCPRASLGITGVAGTLGFREHYNMEDFNDDSQFDGMWGIWDEPFLQAFERGVNGLQEPFVASVFTASSHHPFRLPPGYEERFPEGRIPMHKCIKYADNSLRLFFEKAKKEPWYENTLFVFTGDHCNDADQSEYETSMFGRYLVPIAFYTPDGSLKGKRNGIAMQADIQATVMSYLGYDREFVSFGCDLINTPDDETFAFYDALGTYYYCRDGYVLQFNMDRNLGLFSMDDLALSDNLIEKEPGRAAETECYARAYLQLLLSRIIHNGMVIREEE